jgi:enoyl-CoA hydratase/carnithine racemase
MPETVLIETPVPEICLITLNRPERRNALDIATYAALTAALVAAEQDESIHIIVLTGAHGCFTSGNDLKDLQLHANNGQSDELATAIKFLKVLAVAQKPIIGAIEGFAMGIGTVMLLHFDLVYAGRGVRLRLPFVPLGLCPEGAVSYLLPRIAGTKRASELLLFGEEFDAVEALAAGLVNQLVEPGEALALALKRAQKLAALPMASLVLTKQLIKQDGAVKVLEAIDKEHAYFPERRASPEAQAAFAAFFAKG